MTATASISSDQDVIQLAIQIAAPPQRVFDALTDPRQLMQWWGQKGMYHHTGWKADVRPGGHWRSDGVSDTDGSAYHVEGEFVEVDPPRRLSYTWTASWSGPLKTLVRWDLDAADGGTTVRLYHSGFAQAPQATQNHYQGWLRVVGWMQAYLEEGKTVETR